MPYRGNGWRLGGAVMVGAAALVVVVVVVAGAGQSPTLSPSSLTPPSASPTQVPKQPVTGFGFAAVDDLSSHQLVVFGGVDSYSTTWLWSGNRWSLAHPPVSPPGRFGAAAAFDPLRRVVMLFGGRLAPGAVLNDTWAWDGTTWRQLDAGTGGPPPGEGSVMAWDSVLTEMVLVTSGSSGAETWLWGGDHWARQLRGDLPGPVLDMAVDPVRQTLLAVGCCTADSGAPTWEWDGAAWLPVGTHQPAAVIGLALDPVSDRLLVWGDPNSSGLGRDTWSWDGKDWIMQMGGRLPGFPASEVTYLDGGHVLLLGWLAQPSGLTQQQPVHVWSWSGSTWNQRG